MMEKQADSLRVRQGWEREQTEIYIPFVMARQKGVCQTSLGSTKEAKHPERGRLSAFFVGLTAQIQ